MNSAKVYPGSSIGYLLSLSDPSTGNPKYSWAAGFASKAACSGKTYGNWCGLSLYQRADVVNAMTQTQAENLGFSGLKMGAFASKVVAMATSNPTLVTVEYGANDVCGFSRIADMTSAANFKAQFIAGMSALVAKAPTAKILTTSVPNVNRLWDILRSSTKAKFIWNQGAICQTVLKYPAATCPTGVNIPTYCSTKTAAQIEVDGCCRRYAVSVRVAEYNTALAEACATFANCIWDDKEFFNYNFLTTEINEYDFFHPNLTGQSNLAKKMWSKLVSKWV
jgi:hypothetical protein